MDPACVFIADVGEVSSRKSAAKVFSCGNFGSALEPACCSPNSHKNLLCKLGRCFVGRIQERFWARLVHLLLTPAIVVKPEMKSVPKNSTKFDWMFVGNLGGSNSAFWTRLVPAPCKSKACRCAPDAARLTCMPPACRHMPTARRCTPYLHACIGPLHAAAPPSPAAGRPAA